VLKSMKRNRAISSAGIALGIGLAVSLAGPASGAPATTAPAPAAGNQATAAAPTVAPSQWVKVCDPNNAKLCQISEDYGLVGDPAPIGSVAIQTTPDPKKFAVGIQVPLGVRLDEGIPLILDGTKTATAQFLTCVPAPNGPSYFCLAQAVVDNGFINALKKGKMLQLSLASVNKTSKMMDFPLANFTQAFDGPDQAALARQRENAAKILTEKAQQRAKQLEGAQPKK